MRYPLVTAVMVTGKTPHHEALAYASVVDFARQTWPDRELVVINDGPYSLAGLCEGLREVRVPPGKTLGELRNIGLEQARGDWIIQWDDDDRHHPDRIRQQMEAAQPGRPVTLRRQLRYHTQTRRTLLHERRGPFGIEGTVLHPKTEVRYPPQRRSEDSEFIRCLPRPIVLDNHPSLYVRQYHGHNTWHEQHVMTGRPWRGSVAALLLSWAQPQLLVITGTGRCGTSFVAKVCRECGYDTGGTWDDAVDAGFEHPKVIKINEQIWTNGAAGRELLAAIRRIDARVIKDPRFVRFGSAVLSAWAAARNDLRFLLVRRPTDATVRSMLRDRKRFCTTPPLPTAPDAMRRALENQILDFQRATRRLTVPVMEIEFPEILDQPLDLYHALARFGQLNIEREKFMAVFQRVRDRSKVHF